MAAGNSESEKVSDGDMEEVLELIYGRQKIQACKRYMELRRVSLVEAKNFIESLTEKLIQENPEKFKPETRAGCAAVLLPLALGVVLFLLVLVVR